ncbi:nitrate- and nitrite sensing domain-containing protein [Algibacillus agarilyticus]|uniref:nitrate- and nitrite sensing domain-containing protein n=1 Tax=Algibacillus agarilyticus TaxID=2234133 RepID=UPI000DCF7423|nr:nitrate- and nitrite sensing domain-containing protein [Algibacillus agarilyticus]
MALANEASELMNEVHNERDLSNGYLAKENNFTGPKGEYFGSTGNDFEGPLKEQRKNVDRNITRFNQYLAENAEKLANIPGISGELNGLKTGLTNIQGVREKIDKYMIKDGKVWTLMIYDAAAERFFKLFEAIIRLASSNAELSLLSNAYASLVYLGDRYSVERGVVVRAIYMHKIDYNLYAREKTTRQEINK